MIPIFIAKYKLARFPKGFYFNYIIANKCQLVRNSQTSFSQMLQLIIKIGLKCVSRFMPLPSLVLVSATLAINQLLDYYGLSSLF